VTAAERKNSSYLNRRLLYLLATAVFRRVEPQVKNRFFQRLLDVTEAYAEGKATSDQFFEAYEKADAIPTDKAPGGEDGESRMREQANARL